MDKMLETIKLLAMLCVVLFFGYVGGVVNFYSPFYQPAEASEPSAVTIYGRSASLLSGSDNLDCAFAGDCGYYYGWLSGDCAVYNPHPKLIPKLIKDDFYRGDDYLCSHYILNVNHLSPIKHYFSDYDSVSFYVLNPCEGKNGSV